MKKLSLIFMMIVLIVAGIGSWNWYESISSKGDRHNVNQEDSYDNGRDEHLFGKHMYLDAKMDEFDHLEDVEATADEIVVAKKIGKMNPRFYMGKKTESTLLIPYRHFECKKVSLVLNLNRVKHLRCLRTRLMIKSKTSLIISPAII